MQSKCIDVKALHCSDLGSPGLDTKEQLTKNVKELDHLGLLDLIIELFIAGNLFNRVVDTLSLHVPYKACVDSCSDVLHEAWRLDSCDQDLRQLECLVRRPDMSIHKELESLYSYIRHTF